MSALESCNIEVLGKSFSESSVIPTLIKILTLKQAITRLLVRSNSSQKTEINDSLFNHYKKT